MLLSDYISVIIPTMNPLQERTQKALKHLAASQGVKFETIVLTRNYNWTTGTSVNQGLAAAVGEYILFCCDDCFVDPLTLHAMQQALMNKNIGVVGGLLRYPDTSVQHAGGIFECRSQVGTSLHVQARHRDHHKPMTHYESRDVDFVTGALMMTRRDVIDRVGGYDERCELDWGDVDFCLRASEAGYRVRFVAEATAVHLEGSSRGKRRGSTDWFMERWRKDLTSKTSPELVGGRS